MEEMVGPKVSVIIPTCNRPEYVKKAIESVLEQTYQDFEIIVVDDGMKDRAEEVVKSFSDTRITYIQHSENRGCAASKNTGARNAKGKYIAILDDDDEYLPQKLQLQYGAMESAGDEVAFSFTSAIECFDDREYESPVPEGVQDYHELALRNFSAMHGSMLMYRRDVFLEHGGLDENYPTHTDVSFLVGFTKKYKGIGINKPLVKRTLRSKHEQMGSNVHNRIRGRLMLLEQYKEDFAKHPAFLAKHSERLAKFYREVGDWQNARKNFWKAFTLEPRLIRFAYYVSSMFGGAVYRFYRK